MTLQKWEKGDLGGYKGGSESHKEEAVIRKNDFIFFLVKKCGFDFHGE